VHPTDEKFTSNVFERLKNTRNLNSEAKFALIVVIWLLESIKRLAHFTKYIFF